MRVEVGLECSECGVRNYSASKDRVRQPERLERRKYCPRCRKHTTHRESR